jgi:hypothetical protein
MNTYPPPSPPVVGGHPANHSGTNNHPPQLVVIHSAVMACEVGAARKLGAWNRDGTTGGSWHYATDPAETIQCSYDRYVTWAAPPNRTTWGGVLHVEMADWPAPVPSVKGRALAKLRKTWRWRTLAHRKMLERTARLTAQLCRAYDLPPRYVSATAQRRGVKGWTTHAARTAAYGQSTHWDPGFWPRRRFGRMVARFHAELGEGVNT